MLAAVVTLLRRPSSIWLILFGYCLNLVALYAMGLGKLFLW